MGLVIIIIIIIVRFPPTSGRRPDPHGTGLALPHHAHLPLAVLRAGYRCVQLVHQHPEERDLILSVLPPFAALENHFRSVGHALKSFGLAEEELAFLATMTAFTAAGRGRGRDCFCETN